MKGYLYKIIIQEQRGPLNPILKSILTVLSVFYILAIKLRLLSYKIGLFKSVRLKAPVISIGNITLGGTGKTPLAEAISSYLSLSGKRIALLTRGYGEDEDKALKNNLPEVSVLIGKDRVKRVNLAGKEPFDVFILDDGFQHLRIQRDMDIITINAVNPFGNGFPIPAGVLREPVSHLSRADMVVITRSDLISSDKLYCIRKLIQKINPGLQIFEAVHQPISVYSVDKSYNLDYLKEKPLCGLSGLGDNDSFIKSLINLGSDVRLKALFMDHHKYTNQDLANVIKDCEQNNIRTIVTTEKDWVKLRDLTVGIEGIEFLILKIKFRLKNGEEFYRRLSSIL